MFAVRRGKLWERKSTLSQDADPLYSSHAISLSINGIQVSLTLFPLTQLLEFGSKCYNDSYSHVLVMQWVEIDTLQMDPEWSQWIWSWLKTNFQKHYS